MLLELPDIRPRNPYFSLAIDEAIAEYYGKKLKESAEFQEAALHGPEAVQLVKQKYAVVIVRLWSNPYAIVLGRTCRAEENVKDDFLSSVVFSHSKRKLNAGTALCRRASGGGTVLHGPCNINYSLFFSQDAFPKLYPLKNSYADIIGLVRSALSMQGIQTEMKGLSDIVLKTGDNITKKISGNAQFRKHGFICHHGTLLTCGELISGIAKHLKHPPKEPDYRNGRDHSSFLSYLPETFDLSAFYTCLMDAVQNYTGLVTSGGIVHQELIQIGRIARNLAQELYSSEQWVLHGKYPARRAEARLPAAGKIN